MSNVISMGDKTGERPVRSFAVDHSAEVIIFHGVRIERLTDDMIQATATRSRRLPSLQNQATAEELK